MLPGGVPFRFYAELNTLVLHTKPRKQQRTELPSATVAHLRHWYVHQDLCSGVIDMHRPVGRNVCRCSAKCVSMLRTVLNVVPPPRTTSCFNGNVCGFIRIRHRCLGLESRVPQSIVCNPWSPRAFPVASARQTKTTIVTQKTDRRLLVTTQTVPKQSTRAAKTWGSLHCRSWVAP